LKEHQERAQEADDASQQSEINTTDSDSRRGWLLGSPAWVCDL